MDLISVTNSALRYHKSASNLSVVCEYKNTHQDDITTNFCLLPATNSLMKFWRLSKKQNEDSCLEFWRIKKSNQNELDFIRKIKGTGISAVAASNRSDAKANNIFATGYQSGDVRIRQLTSDMNLLHQFKDQKSGVLHLDFNCNNENVASTHENGMINIFSLNTRVKYDSIKLDSMSTLSRFHPSKRAMLGISSYQGSVTLYDVFGKKAIFKNAAHTAPCADVAFSESYLLSCGYDCVINIFDIRKQKAGLKINGTYGWTSISMSKCGAYFVGGNMKGELISYDMRSIKKPLTSARVENGSHKISRVDFLNKTASGVDDSNALIDLAVRESLEAVEEEIQKSPSRAFSNDSFIEDIVDFHRGRISDFSSNVINHGTRLSAGSSSSLEIQKNNLEDFDNDSTENLEELYVNKNKRGSSSLQFSKRRSSIRTPLLQHINEENIDKENDSQLINTPKNALLSTIRNTSTPSIKANNEDVIESNESLASNEKQIMVPEVASNFNMRKEFDTLKDELCEKIRIEVGMLNFDEENRYIKVMSQIVNQRQRLQERVNMIEESMALLMSDDFKINRILELQAENDELRAQNQDLLRRMSR